MAKKLTSRTARWAAMVEQANDAVEKLREAVDELRDIQSEYEEWSGNLPDSLEGSPVAEKLEAVLDIDFDVIDDIENAIADAANLDLPLGFGRD